jgi:hypothetical protein
MIAHRYGRLARALLLASMTGWFLLNPSVQGARESAFAAGEMSQDQFDQRIHDYILAHPEVLVQALQSLDQRQREADAAQAKAVLVSRGRHLPRQAEPYRRQR